MGNDYIPFAVKALISRLDAYRFQRSSDANEALETLKDLLSSYAIVSIADVYDAYMITFPFAYQNAADEWGWDEKTINELRPMMINPYVDKNGKMQWKYTITFPAPKKINEVQNMCSTYVPFTGGIVRSNPYEITRYERKLSFSDGDECEMEILCKDEAALINLRHFIKSLHCDELMQATVDMTPNSRVRINIKTRHQPLAASIKKFVDNANRQPQAKSSNKPVFQYGHDVIPLGQIGEVKIDPQGIEFTCNVGRKNGKSMASKDLMDALSYSNYVKYVINDIKEMENMKVVAFELMPKKIIFSGPKCIVLWVDGTKTIVSCSENDQWDEYAAYCAALAKKIYGTTSAVHRMVDKKSNAKEYRESQEVSVHIDGKHSLGKALAEAMYKAMEPFMKENNDESSEH